MSNFENYIDGRWTPPETGEYFEQHNPADIHEVTGLFPQSDEADARAALGAAERAFPEWRATSVQRRAGILNRALALMRERVSDLSEVLTRENGKTLAESRAEVNAAIKEMEFQIAEGVRQYGDTLPVEHPGVLAYSKREPLGVVSVISPWNFPFNVPGRKCTPALMAGNTCVLKPASLTPRTGIEFVRLFHDAGLPRGVINLVVGPGRTVGESLIADARVKAISFTGSTAVGKRIQQTVAGSLTRTQLELGGKNPAVVLEDADLDAAVKATTRAAFACAGQWCTSTSRAIVVREIYDTFLTQLIEQTRKLRVGNGLDPEVNMGPVCGKDQFDSISSAIEAAKHGSARLLVGGTSYSGNGYFIEPTVFADVEPTSPLAQEEIFGPVLSVIPVESFDEAVRVANEVPYGLCSSVFTADLSRALAFVEASDVGLTHVNMMTALKEPQFTFGGRKDSGFGIPEAGKTGIEFFTQHKVAYLRFR